MDRKTALWIAGLVLLAILMLRARLLDAVTRAGGFAITPVAPEVVEIPAVETPPLPVFRKGPEFWTQTTGLMCACDRPPFNSPVVVQDIALPMPPIPHYVTVPEPTQTLSRQQLTYGYMWIDSHYAIWGNRPGEGVWHASDGRMFLMPRPQPLFYAGVWNPANPSHSNNFIGTDEYTTTTDKYGRAIIHYGPYDYYPDWGVLNKGT